MWPMPGNTATAQKRARRFSAAALHEVVLTTTRCRPGGEDALAGLRVNRSYTREQTAVLAAFFRWR